MSRHPNVPRLERRGDTAGLQAAAAFSRIGPDGLGGHVDYGAEVRVQAIDALSRSADPEAIPALVGSVSDPVGDVRLAGIAALSARGEPAAITALAGVAVTGAPEERTVALRALREAARHDSAVARKTVDRLLQARGDVDKAAVRGVADIIAGEVEGSRRKILTDVVVSARSLSGPARECVVLLLAEVPDSRGLLLGLLEDDPAELVAVEALGQMRDSAATPVLVRMLQTGDAPARAAAARALVRIQDPRAVPALLQAGNDPDAPVRLAASSALEALGTAATWSFAGAARSVEPSPDIDVVAELPRITQAEPVAHAERLVADGTGSSPAAAGPTTTGANRRKWRATRSLVAAGAAAALIAAGALVASEGSEPEREPRVAERTAGPTPSRPAPAKDNGALRRFRSSASVARAAHRRQAELERARSLRAASARRAARADKPTTTFVLAPVEPSPTATAPPVAVQPPAPPVVPAPSPSPAPVKPDRTRRPEPDPRPTFGPIDSPPSNDKPADEPSVTQPDPVPDFGGRP